MPDPKSQVEQITIALIYKFMDDMDAESEELGGKRKFFTGDYARYGWAKLMAPSLDGHEMLGLYGEGISKMPENPGIPALFRDIFKNAYLPETWRAHAGSLAVSAPRPGNAADCSGARANGLAAEGAGSACGSRWSRTLIDHRSIFDARNDLDRTAAGFAGNRS